MCQNWYTDVKNSQYQPLLRQMDQQQRPLAVRIYSRCYTVRSGVDALTKGFNLAMNRANSTFSGCKLSPWGYWKTCFLVALFCITVRRLNLEVTTKTHLHQQVEILGYFQCHVVHGSMSLQLFLEGWIFRRALDVIFCDNWVFSEGHKNYF